MVYQIVDFIPDNSAQLSQIQNFSSPSEESQNVANTRPAGFRFQTEKFIDALNLLPQMVNDQNEESDSYQLVDIPKPARQPLHIHNNNSTPLSSLPPTTRFIRPLPRVSNDKFQFNLQPSTSGINLFFEFDFPIRKNVLFYFRRKFQSKHLSKYIFISNISQELTNETSKHQRGKQTKV